MARIARTAVLMAFIMPVFLSACADFFEYEEMEITDIEDMKGPGVFSGESGEFVIYQR